VVPTAAEQRYQRRRSSGASGSGICIPMNPGTHNNFIKHKIDVNNVFYS
jgi:hypothetical protein